MADALQTQLKGRDINSIFEQGLHEFISGVITDTAQLAQQIAEDYRFTG